MVKPYIPEKVKNKAVAAKNKVEKVAKNFIERYKKVNKPKEIKTPPKSDNKKGERKNNRGYEKEGARPKILKRNEEKEIDRRFYTKGI